MASKTLRERFSRGDDSVLNADSSAERRLVEGVLLVKLGSFAVTSLGGDLAVRPTFDLKATTGLPLSVGGDPAGNFLQRLVAQSTSINPLDLFTPTMLARLPQRISNVINPAQVPEGSEPGTVGIQVSGEVQLDDFIIGVLAAGYLVEKATPAIGGIGENLVAAAGGVKTLAKDVVT